VGRETNSFHFSKESYMHRPNRILLSAVLVVVVAMTVFAQQKQYRLIATTSWTAAFALAAGATDVAVLAPAELRHPAEYELRPSDIMALSGADLILSTGFEAMAKKLADAAGTRHIPLLQVDADYSLSTMKKSILAIAAAIGTTAKAGDNIAVLEKFMESWKQELQQTGMSGTPVLAHVFQRPLLVEIGFSIQGVFGPAPLEATQIAKLSAAKAALIVDNWHNEASAPLRETLTGVRWVSFINFPGPDGTVTLLDVLADNRKRLSQALK
jgi:hypothetical protein